MKEIEVDKLGKRRKNFKKKRKKYLQKYRRLTIIQMLALDDDEC